MALFSDILTLGLYVQHFHPFKSESFTLLTQNELLVLKVGPLSLVVELNFKVIDVVQ